MVELAGTGASMRVDLLTADRDIVLRVEPTAYGQQGGSVAFASRAGGLYSLWAGWTDQPGHLGAACATAIVQGGNAYPFPKDAS